MLPPGLDLEFAPVHKRAFGVAVGMVCAMAVAGITAFHVLAAPADALPIGLLAQYFRGYSVSWTGVLTGGLWGFVTGFVAGWFVAFVRNFVLAFWMVALRARAGLASSFLDHI